MKNLLSNNVAIDQEEMATLNMAVEKVVSDISKVSYSFLAGSRVEGLGTEKSDYDVYVVLKEREESAFGEIFVPSNIGMVEVTILDDRKIAQIINRFSEGFNKGAQISQNDLLLAHRIATAIPLINSDHLQYLKSKLERDMLSTYLSKYSAALSEKCLSDAIGNALSQDEDSAIFNAIRALEQSLDHILALQGNTSPLVKWRTRYAKKYLGESSPILIRYFELATANINASARKKREHIEAIGRFIQAAFDFGHAKRKFPTVEYSLSECRLWGTEQLLNRKRVLSKRPLTRVVESNGGIYLVDLEPLFEITNDVLAVWLAINNARTEDEVVLFCCQNFKGLNADYIKLCIDKLKSKDIIH